MCPDYAALCFIKGVSFELARIEGIDFIVDSLGMKINENLTEHIDGLRTYYKNFNKDFAE